MHAEHGQNFEAFLHKQFRDVPGQRHVNEKQYRIMRNGVIIHQANWPGVIQPGSDVEMSGLVLSWKTTGKQCPRPGCAGEGTWHEKTSFFECPKCSLIYARDEGSPRLVELPAGLDEGKTLIPKPTEAGKHFRRIHVSWVVSPSRRSKASAEAFIPTRPKAPGEERGNKWRFEKHYVEPDVEYTGPEDTGLDFDSPWLALKHPRDLKPLLGDYANTSQDAAKYKRRRNKWRLVDIKI